LYCGWKQAELARVLEVSPNVLDRCWREFRQASGNVFPSQGQRRWSEDRVAELGRKIGLQAMDVDFLKGCLLRIEEQRMLQTSTGNHRPGSECAKVVFPVENFAANANMS
jgi:transposase